MIPTRPTALPVWRAHVSSAVRSLRDLSRFHFVVQLVTYPLRLKPDTKCFAAVQASLWTAIPSISCSPSVSFHNTSSVKPVHTTLAITLRTTLSAENILSRIFYTSQVTNELIAKDAKCTRRLDSLEISIWQDKAFMRKQQKKDM